MRPLCWITVACALLQAQTPVHPGFEVASLRPSGRLTQGYPSRRIVGGPGTSSPGQITYTEQSLKDLIFMAYRVPFYQLTTPPWMEREYFDITAKVPPGATRDDVRLMLQDLLAERFKLKIRHEAKETPGYVLTIGRGGPRMKASPAPQAGVVAAMPPKFDLDRDGFIIVPPGTTNMMTLPSSDGIARLTASRASMEILCGYLSRQLQRPVLDRTGLTGTYDFHLAYARGNPRQLAVSEPPEAPDSNATVPVASDPAPTLVKAVELQLGLKMQPGNVRIDILVIDHVEKTPIEN